MANIFWVGIVIALVFTNWVDAYHINETELSLLEAHEASISLIGRNPLMVGLTLIHTAAAKGAGTIQFQPSFFLICLVHLDWKTLLQNKSINVLTRFFVILIVKNIDFYLEFRLSN